METMLLSNPAAFFAAVRVDLFGGAFEQTQVDGINSILKAWPEGTDPRFVAYGLATAYHETARTMEPIAEWGRGQGKAYGIPCGPYQQRYYGRGFVQLTWLSNYERAEKAILGSDLVRTPDNALLPAIAAEVLVRGMSEGWFTGKRLADFFPPGAPEMHDWVGARAIVNGQDRTAQIAAYAVHFNGALAQGGPLASPAPVPVPAPSPPAEPSPPAAPKESLVQEIVEAVEGLFEKGKPA
jgi:putative chitinase